MSEWEAVPLADLCDSIQYGVTTSAKPAGFEGPRLLRITDIVPPRINWATVPPCDVSDRDSLKFALKAGDIVVARTGATVGYAKYVAGPPLPAVFASYLVRFRVRDDVDARFVGHVVESDAYKHFVAANAGGAAQPNANAKTLGAFLIPLPEAATQRRIAAVLSAFDGLIAINERRIELLMDLARSLYLEWFVRFRFPSRETVDFVDSLLGPVPRGWAVGRLDDHLLLARGFDLPVDQRSDGRVPVVSASGVSGSHSTAKSGGPGVVTGRSGTIGRVTYVSSDYWPLNTTLWVKEFRLATPRSAYFLLESLGLKSHASGAAVPTLNRNHIHGLPVVRPPRGLVAAFDDAVAPIFELIDTLGEGNRVSRRVRDLLLPRLVTGRLDISDVGLGDLGPSGVV